MSQPVHRNHSAVHFELRWLVEAPVLHLPSQLPAGEITEMPSVPVPRALPRALPPDVKRPKKRRPLRQQRHRVHGARAARRGATHRAANEHLRGDSGTWYQYRKTLLALPCQAHRLRSPHSPRPSRLVRRCGVASACHNRPRSWRYAARQTPGSCGQRSACALDHHHGAGLCCQCGAARERPRRR
jgi:hypothetical protein